jgi:amino acid adenylation domain-containing protein/thioester reductase-like protein
LRGFSSARARIINFYGPTEITVCCTYADVTHAKAPSIGKPMHNVKTYILDAHMNPVPVGVPGELYIGGNGVARGYINNPELSRKRFIDNPFIPNQKLYRTGDLTRWYPLGEIEFLGRIDKQVKIRGYRIEPGEIENRLMQISGITSCAVTDRIDSAGRKFLCAYLCGNPPKMAEIKFRLERELPAYMIPSYFVPVENLPFNASGKVDRDRLPDPLREQTALKEDYVPPLTATEQILAGIWSNSLNIRQIGRCDSFFDIGGDSLTIINVMAQVMQKFHVDISLEKVYRSPRLKDFAMLIDAAERCAYRPILPVPAGKSYPVSSSQQRMWILSQGHPRPKAYNIPIAFALKGKLDISRMRLAFKKLIGRHDALRTTFELKGHSLYQIIHEKAEFEIDFMQCNVAKVRSVLQQLIKPFDFAKAPLMHAAVIQTGDDRYILFIDMHHSISDKRSLDILLKDLTDFYQGNEPVSEEIEYKDYAVWQQEFLQSENIALQRDYWQSVLTGELPLLNLHTDKPRSAVQRFEGARISFEVSQKTVDKLRAFAHQRDATLFMAVLAVYNVLLAKYTGQEDIIIGTPVSGRTRPEIQNTVGVFINTLPLRNYPRQDISFSEFFEELHQNSMAAFAHSDYPLERVISDLSLPRDLSRNPLFDTMLVMADGTFDLELKDIKCTHYSFDPKIAKLDLTLEIYEAGGGFQCRLEYNTRLFRRSTIKRMSMHLSRLFEILMDQPEIRICDVAILTQDELWQVTQGFNQTDVPFDEERTIQSLFEGLAVSQGSKTALVCGGKTISFAVLNNRANQIARWLRERGVGRNTIVALCIHRSFDMMAGLLGILKAGGGYFPLDPQYPPERVSFMLSDSGTKILLTDGKSDNYDFNGEIFRVQDIPDSGPCANLAPIDRMEDAAYVIYTSGSTGVPKGAVLSRRALLNLYEAAKSTIAYDKGQTCVSVTTISFDIFIVDALLPLLFGCTVAICTEEELRQPYLLAALIESVNVKFIQTTPTRMRIMMEDASFRAAAGKHIEKIVLGGEEFPLSLLKLLKKHTKARIISGYGPTETTVYCSFKDLSKTSHITIGKPIVNTRMYILDQYRRPVPIGVLGQVYISGACVATGYINRVELNRRKFIPDPFWPGHMMYESGDICAFTENGEMEIRGRVDHQVKIRGLRIELGEIEAAMREVDGVEEAVVKDWDEGVNKYLCAYYITGREVGQETLREHLNKKLPAYMIPSYFIGMKELPMTLNGKVNRSALPKPDKQTTIKSAISGIMTETEKRMAKIWSRILKTGNIGPEDNFFALGGDSLCVIKVQAAVLQYGWKIRTKDFYDCQTLRAICKRLNTEQYNTLPIAKREPDKNEDRFVPTYNHLKRTGLKNVFLTGATGYLGAHILEQLTQRPGTHVHCLIRGKDNKACERYLREVLTFYFGVDTCRNILAHVTVVKGNVSGDQLGMSEESYAKIKQIDTIIHSAAITDHVGRAEEFYQTNVLGTRHVAKLAADIKATLLYMSTISVAGTHYVSDTSRRGEFTENCFYVGQNYGDNEYVKSKFQAEEIVLNAIADGLDARIFRVGLLTGTLDGRFQMRPEKNAFANRIKALCAAGCVPISMLKAKVEMTPVDACAKAILTLSTLPYSNQTIYHVFNANSMTLGDIVSLLEQNGYFIKTISDQEFMHCMTQLSKSGNFAILTGLIEDLDVRQAVNISITANTTIQLLARAGFYWPMIDAKYMGRFVSSIICRQSKEI